MKKKAITTRIQVSPFLRMKAESIDWQGYNPTLVEEVCERGLELEQENKEYRDVSPQEAHEKFWVNLSQWVGAFVALLICGGVVIGVAAAIHSDKYREGYQDGRSSAVSAAIAFVEAKYRHVDPSQIRLEFPNGTEVFSLKDYVRTKGYNIDNMSDRSKKEFAKEYANIIENEGAYTLFITPMTGKDDPKK